MISEGSEISTTHPPIFSDKELILFDRKNQVEHLIRQNLGKLSLDQLNRLSGFIEALQKESSEQ